MLKNFDNKEKLTKKQYFDLIQNTTHFNIGSIYTNTKGVYNISPEELLKKLNKDFLNLGYLTKNCLLCLGAKQNTVDFLHISNKIGVLHESKKGAFYIIKIDNSRSLILHYYKDSCNTISFKVIVNTTSVLDQII